MPHPPLVDATRVRHLITDQFPEWSDLEVRPVAGEGSHNRMFHLGDALVVRLPKTGPDAAPILKEQIWLPKLAPLLPVSIPCPVAFGEPGPAFPFPWSVYDWLPGETAADCGMVSRTGFANDLADFLKAFQRIDPAGGPAAGEETFFRGAALVRYDRQTRDAIDRLRGKVDTGRALALWERALACAWERPGVWVHGDVAAGNLLVRESRLSAVIDFGLVCVGDPACDLAIAWTYLDPAARAAFKSRLAADEGTWNRGRGWALWKALIVVAGFVTTNAVETRAAPRTLASLLRDGPDL